MNEIVAHRLAKNMDDATTSGYITYGSILEIFLSTAQSCTIGVSMLIIYLTRPSSHSI